MKIWLINQYNMPPDFGHLNRHFNIGKYLEKTGNQPVVFVGSFLHNSNKQMIKGKSLLMKFDNPHVSYYFVKTCSYANSKIKRIIAMFQFYKNLFKVVKKFDKPDVILGSSAHPLSALAAIKLAKKYKCMSIVEIRDLWPESFVAYGIIKKNNPLLKLFYIGEKWIYKNSDKIIFTMEGGKNYIVEQEWDKLSGGPVDLKKIHHLNNGVDLEVFNYNREHNQINDDDLNDSKTFKVIYTGSIRLVNNLKKIIEIAQELKKMNPNNIRFLLYGDGTDREYLEEFCAQNNIDNVIFKGYVDKKYIPYILSKSDLNIFHFKQNEIKKYGASLNKMFEYFASGKPTLSDCEFGYDLIKKYKCGVVLDNATAYELANEIRNIQNMTLEEYDEMCVNALNAAEDYDFKKLSNKLLDIINGGKYI